MLNSLKESFFIISFFAIFLYLPSHCVFKLLSIQSFNSKLSEIGLKLGFGLVIFTLFSLLIRSMGISQFIYWILPLISSAILIYQKDIKIPKLKFSLSLPNAIVAIIILICVLAQTSLLIKGQYKDIQGNEYFPAAHDVLWNISIVNEIYHNFPPEHPGFAGEPLKNHHFLYHLFLSSARFITGIGSIKLYYFYGPVFVSLLFALSIYTVSSLFIKNLIFRSLSIFLGFFSGSFSYLLPLFLGSDFNWKKNIFLADQPGDQIINPYTVLGITIYLFIFFAVHQIVYGKSRGFIVITAALAGSIYGFKSFGGVIILISFTLLTLFSLYKRNVQIVVLYLFTLIIFFPIFIFITEFGSVSLNWAPGWILTVMMTDANRLNLPSYAAVEHYYQSIGNIPGLIKIKLIEFIIYLVGNLGTRLLGFLYFFIIVIRSIHSKQKINPLWILFLFINITIALSIPLLFNLSVNSYDIMQFTPYAIILFSIFSVVCLERIQEILKKKKIAFVGVLIIIAIIALSIPFAFTNFNENLHSTKGYISKDELEALYLIKKNSASSDIILIDPSISDSMYISAISERRLYLGDTSLVEHTGISPKKRKQEVEQALKNLDISFFKENNISFLYLMNNTSNIKLKYHFPIFLQQENIIIYRVVRG